MCTLLWGRTDTCKSRYLSFLAFHTDSWFHNSSFINVRCSDPLYKPLIKLSLRLIFLLLSSCTQDNCPSIYNPSQTDVDNDGIGNKCDHDIDNDGIENSEDNCKFIYNPSQSDVDNDGVGDFCDNCKNISNPKQDDENYNQIGDECEGNVDQDKDGVPDQNDNCPTIENANQDDTDEVMFKKGLFYINQIF